MIIKLIDKLIGYLVMLDKLNPLWKPSGEINLVDIGKGFYMVKFDVRADRVRTISMPKILFAGHKSFISYSEFINSLSWVILLN